MYEFRVHTLVDVTENGNLRREFPFKTKTNEVIHDKHTLTIARNQNSNFNTMTQLLQIRGNITWEIPPIKLNEPIANMRFGSVYNGKQNSWHFTFFVEQSEVYGQPQEPTAQLIEDFDLVPILSFCKETATFPSNTFITEDDRTINTYFSYQGITNK